LIQWRHGGQSPLGFLWFFTGTGFRVTSRAFLGFFEAIALSLELQQLGFVHEPIDEGYDAGGVREDLGPFAERFIRGDDDGVFLVAARDDLEEQVRIARVVGEVPDLIDREDSRAGIATQAARERDRGVLGGQIVQHVGGEREAGRVGRA
jgi:hypothetical protein